MFDTLRDQLHEGASFQTKLRAGGVYTPVGISVRNERMWFAFPYNEHLLAEIKESFENRRWHGFETPAIKQWSAPITERNLFRLSHLQGRYAAEQPYRRWDALLDKARVERARGLVYDFCKRRHKPLTPYRHQVDLIANGLITNWFLWAAEMGTGKTLSAIILLEMFLEAYPQLEGDLFWIGPKSALHAVEADFDKWDCKLPVQFYTYEGLKKVLQEWQPGRKAPLALICDESSRCKNPTAQRSIAVQYCAKAMRHERSNMCIVGLMSGSPAPKSPPDWYMQCEIIAPGFVREQNQFVFRDVLGIFEKVESETGGYKKLVTWLDDPAKCAKCGQPKEHPDHGAGLATIYGQKPPHKFVASKNEVARLSKRLNGLVTVKLKKDCLDLPEKRFRLIDCEPSTEVLNAAQLIVKTTPRAPDALIKLRTLSDGFLYQETPTGQTKTCPGCEGRGTQTEYVDANDPYNLLTPEEIAEGSRFVWESVPEEENPSEFIPQIVDKIPIKIVEEEVECYECGGEKIVPCLERTLVEVPCPKDDVLIQLLDEHEECGRLNIYGGFQGTIDRIEKICHRFGWTSFKADGRGWAMRAPTGGTFDMSPKDMLKEYDSGIGKIAFIGQPGAAGMGLTLTASPTTFFFSNDYNPESRQQAMDRGHRIGMDVIRGGWIVDVTHLPSDIKVLQALAKSAQLQHLSMTGINLKEIYCVKDE